MPAAVLCFCLLNHGGFVVPTNVNMAMAGMSAVSLLDRDAVRLQQEASGLVNQVGNNLQQGELAGGFEALLRRVDDRDQAAAQRMEAVERGESDDLVGAMLASQEASLSFSMLMQVRNKVVGAVDELIKLQL
jgi:flagellar hook-basal body complex protein FliE